MRRNSLKFFNDNHSGVIAAGIVLLIMLWSYGCQSKVRSLDHPNTLITRDELKAEVDGYLAMARARLADLDRQDEIKLLLFEQASLFSQSGVINPAGLLTTVVSVFAVGSALDQRRKNLELQKKVNGTATNQTSAA